MFKRFEKITGSYIETISGQQRFAFSHSDAVDFYDLPERLQSGSYSGSVLRFHDLATGKVYQPFDKQQNVLYGNPVCLKGRYYFLQGDFNRGVIRLYQCVPDRFLQQLTELPIDKINLYNLHIIGEAAHIVSQDEQLVCYYPQKFPSPWAAVKAPYGLKRIRSIWKPGWKRAGMPKKIVQPTATAIMTS